MIPHFIPHHVKIAHILMNRNQQTDTNSPVILGDIPELPAKEGIFVGGDPTNVMPNDTSNIPVVSFRNAFQRNIAMSDEQVVGNGQQFFEESQNDTAAATTIIGSSSIQSDSYGISDEINTSVNTVDTNNDTPSMQLVSSINDNRGIPMMRAAAEFVDISDAVAMRPIGEFQDQSNQDSKQNESSPTDFAKSVINTDDFGNFGSPASSRSKTANDGQDKPRVLVDIVFPTLRPPVSDANLRPIEKTTINSGEVFSRTNGVSGLNINKQSSSSTTNIGGNSISPELTGVSNFNLPDGQVIEFGGATIQNAPSTNTLRQTVSSNIISVPARSSQKQDMNIQQIGFPKQLVPVVDDRNSGRQNLNGFSDNTLVMNGNRPADNANGVNQDTVGRNGQFMSDNQVPFSGRFDENMPNDQQSNTGMLGISSSRGQTVQGNQFINDLTDRMQSGNKIAGGKDSTIIASVQNNMQPINDNFGPANWDIRVRQTTSNGNTNMPNRNGEQNMQGNVNSPNSNMVVMGNQQVAPHQDNERVFTGIIEQGGQQLVTNGQPLGENVGSSIRNGRLTMPNSPETISGNNMISGPNTFNNQFVGQTGPFIQPVMNSNMGPRVQNGRPVNIGQSIPGEAGSDARNAGTFQQGNQASVFNGQSTQTIRSGNIGTVGENGQTSNLNERQVLGMQQSINSNIDTASRDNQARKFNQPMNPQITDNQRMNNQAMTNQNMNSIQPISMQGINLNQQLNNPGVNGMNSQVTGSQGNAMFNQMNIQGLNGINTQVPGGMNGPVVNGMNSQGQNGMNNPGLNVMNSQVTGGMNGPVVNGINTPGLNGINSQVTGAQGNAMFNQMNNQGANRMNSPAINGMTNPGVNGMNNQVGGSQGNSMFTPLNSPGANGVNNQGANRINNPGANGMNTQDTGPQGNTMFNQMNSQGGNGMNSPGVNGMNNPGTNGINNPGVNGMNNQGGNGMNNPGVNGMNSQGGNGMNTPGTNGMNNPGVNVMNSQGGNGMNNPGANGMNNPGVNGMNSQGRNGMNNPGANGINNPGVNGMNNQGVNRMTNPGVNGMNIPGVNGVNSQSGNGMNNPGANGMNNPGVNGMNNPGVNGVNSQGGNGMNNPGANGMNNPGVNAMNSQGGNGMNNPGVNGINNPGVNRMNSQVPGPQGAPMFNQMNSQGLVQIPNGAGAQMNNMGTIQPSNGQVQASGQQINPWMMQGNFQNSMNGVPHSPNDPFTMNSNGGFQGSANMNLNPQQNNNRIRNFDGSFGSPMQQPQQQNPFTNMGQFMPMPFNG
ncbi:hypothetical protein ACJMK2_025125 [Sinanodonta woodiana]|uniref:Uncharacterized protein n=1 Tax=Sinanodonta woodiana TaxID=1069815 RepID=A0ABD3XHH4_SINWO